MKKAFNKVVSLILTAIVLSLSLCTPAFAIYETEMGFFVDAGKSTSEYLDIVYSSELWDRAADDKKIDLYYYADNSDYATFITTRREFESALEAGKITYVTSISSTKAEVKRNEYNIYGAKFNAVRINWSEENLSSDGYYLVHIEAGTFISNDGRYGNAETFVPNQVVPRANFLTKIIENIKASFESIVEWFSNLFKF